MIKIFHYSNKNILFRGQYPSFKDAVEDAVAKGVALDGADFSKQNMMHVNLDGAQLKNVCFSGANLTGANMTEACFENCVFYNADLYNAFFSYSCFKNCSFKDSNFGDTNFSAAILEDCVFSLATCGMVQFSQTQILRNCLFEKNNGVSVRTSKAPLSILGLGEMPIIFIDGAMVYGEECRSRDLDFFAWPSAPPRINNAHVYNTCLAS